MGGRPVDPVYSDCGATVLANYKQITISGAAEPQRADRLRPAPRPARHQDRACRTVRLHDPDGGHHHHRSPPSRVYSNSEDGLYGPAVDNNFATNKWVYLYYAPPTVTNVKQSDGSIAASITTPPTATAPDHGRVAERVGSVVGYFQLSRFKFVEAHRAPGPPRPGSEQKIMKVESTAERAATSPATSTSTRSNNLWLVTGDDTPAGGGNSGGF